MAISSLFLLSSVAGSVLIVPASALPNSPSLAARPLSQLEANWASPDGNSFNQNYNPQSQINSSNAQYLGLSWLFPLPTHPTALLSVSGGLGVDTAPLIINGTIYMVTQYAQVFALNAQNGNVLWTDVLPIFPNSTIPTQTAVGLHLHNGDAQFTTKWQNTPTFWVAAPDHKAYAINALNGKYELNFTLFAGPQTVPGNNANAVGTGISNILVDQNRGILVSSVESGSAASSGRCFYRGWNINVNPPTKLWESYCTPPQPTGSLPVDPTWEIKQVNSLKGAQIFYPGPQYNAGGYIPGTAVVDLKKLSPAQLNATLYDDWGYVNQSPDCKAYTAGSSTGSTAAGWGAPWLLGTGPTSGMAFVNTNNKDPYAGPCTPGPDLWAASVLALNVTTGAWIWGFQTAAHELWDYDCSWWQAMGNETVNGVNTPVIWKTCKNGYLYELNALNGNMIWAWTPTQNIMPRLPWCFMLDPTNKTQMSYPYFNPTALGARQGTLMSPSEAAGFENEASYSPTLNYLFIASHNVPFIAFYVPPNATNYFHGYSGIAAAPPAGAQATIGTQDNSTIMAVNAATGQMLWSYFVPAQGYRGGVTNSGNVVYVTLSSGDLLLLNAQNGNLIKDLYIGGPLNVLPSVGATASGQMEVILPITAGIVTWGTGVPGDIVALTLQNIPAATTNFVTSTSTVSAAPQTSTATSTVTSSVAGGGVDPTLLYGIAGVAVIFIIATGFLAMRGRPKPAP